MPDLFDTHCHLTAPQLQSDCERIIGEAVEAGVRRMLTVACGLPEIEPALDLARRHPGHIWVAAGIHPHEAARVTQAEISRLAELWRECPIVAAGEMGLDYHYDFSPRDVQRAVFSSQLEIAAAADLPVIVHCREAHDDVVRILIERGYRDRAVVFHCFSGTRQEAAELWSYGWWTSFTGVITFKNASEQQAVCADTDLSAILFETDAPYLSPEPVRRIRPNEPRNITHTVRFAARLRGVDADELAAVSTANAMRFFRLQPPA